MKNSPPARIAAFMSLLSFLDASWQNFAFRPGRSANIFLVHNLRSVLILMLYIFINIGGPPSQKRYFATFYIQCTDLRYVRDR